MEGHRFSLIALGCRGRDDGSLPKRLHFIFGSEFHGCRQLFMWNLVALHLHLVDVMWAEGDFFPRAGSRGIQQNPAPAILPQKGKDLAKDLQRNLGVVLPGCDALQHETQQSSEQVLLWHVGHLLHKQDRSRLVGSRHVAPGLHDIILDAQMSPEVVLATDESKKHLFVGPDLRSRKLHGTSSIDHHDGRNGLSHTLRLRLPHLRKHHLAAT
mmetsp:Transcript_57308/g.125472  ORF Transcript_57308/g.125472 Transcript_57308/m.125472 type:complete len:212 (+) Transcript_57308:363-998(+)